MRIATTTAYTQSVSAMNAQNYQLNKTMLQLSTGKRIIVPSDDPAASARVLGLNQAIERTDQFQNNISALKSDLQIEETALNSIVNTLQRVRELAIQGNNDTYDANQRKDIAQEIKQSLEAITSFANMANGGGDFLFGGFNNRDVPFEMVIIPAVPPVPAHEAIAYKGDQGQQFLQIGPTRQIASGDNGYDLFMNIKGSDNGSPPPPAVDPSYGIPMSVFAIVKELEFALETNEGIQGHIPENAIPSGTEDFHQTVSRSIGNIDKALSHIVDAQASIGARLNATDNQESLNEDYLIQLNSTLSTTQDLDYAEAISRLELEQVGLQAAQQSFTRIQSLSLFNYL
ncbi:MAG: flagellar hook-associated protein FlgL [gamma proteobacterium symbiont of Taylorina sp.]|nr:flagellar hook-associated protein FlgL [gamma proteobacterium symbiont of Taylorina sp.]